MEDTSTLSTLAALLNESSLSRNVKSTIDQACVSDSAKCEITTKTGDKFPSIFDISKNDRNRILKLVEELLDTQEDVDKLRTKLSEERADFREKRSVLIKKLDRLSEKHEKAVCEIELLKERYSSSLKELEEKISTVSDKLETSVVEIKELRQANAGLIKENSALRNQNYESAAVIASFQEEREKNSDQKQKERLYRKQLKKSMPAIKVDDKIRMSSSESSLKQGELMYQTNSFKEEKDNNTLDKCSGAGDFATNLKSSSLETIKAPAIVIFDKSLQSVLNQPSQTKVDVDTTSNCDTQKFSSFNDLDDTALLENLFFRF